MDILIKVTPRVWHFLPIVFALYCIVRGFFEQERVHIIAGLVGFLGYFIYLFTIRIMAGDDAISLILAKVILPFFVIMLIVGVRDNETNYVKGSILGLFSLTALRIIEYIFRASGK